MKEPERIKKGEIYVIQGKYGQGKSSFALKLLHDWKNKSKGIFYMKGEDLKWNLLMENESNPFKELNSKCKSEINIQENEIIILDGWDEIVHLKSEAKPEDIKSVLKNLRLYKGIIIITCREDFIFDDWVSQDVITLKALSKEQIELIAKNYDDPNGKNAADFILRNIQDDEGSFLKLMQDTTGLIPMILKGDIDLKEVDNKITKLYDEIIKKKFEEYISNKNNEYASVFPEQPIDLFQDIAFLFHLETNSYAPAKLSSLFKKKKLELLNEIIDVDAVSKIRDIIQENKSIVSSLGVFKLESQTSKSIHFKFTNNFIREFLNARKIWKTFDNLAKGGGKSDEIVLKTVQSVFGSKLFSDATWNYISIFSQEEESNSKEIGKKLDQFFRDTLRHEGLYQYGLNYSKPVTIANNSFHGFWRLLMECKPNVLNEEKYNLDSTITKEIIDLIDRVNKQPHKDRLKLNHIIWNHIREKEGRNYANCDFLDLKISNSTFSTSNFRNSNFFNCRLINSTFRYCDFSYCKFDAGSMRGVTFYRCNFESAIFENVEIKDDVNTRVSFSESEMQNIKFMNIDFKESKDATILSAKFPAVSLYNGIFTNVKFVEVDFNQSILDYSEFNNCLIEDNINLDEASMISGKLKGLYGLNFEDIKRCKTLFDAELDENIRNQILSSPDEKIRNLINENPEKPLDEYPKQQKEKITSIEKVKPTKEKIDARNEAEEERLKRQKEKKEEERQANNRQTEELLEELEYRSSVKNEVFGEEE